MNKVSDLFNDTFLDIVGTFLNTIFLDDETPV